METTSDSVQISLKEYLRLYEMEKALRENKILVEETNYRFKTICYFFTQSQAVEEVSRINERLIKEAQIQCELADNHYRGKLKLEKDHKIEILRIRNFSIWQFLKWRKTND